MTLLAAASELVAERGIERLTIADVLNRAELGTRAFYRNFSSKDQLIEAVFVDLAQLEAVRLKAKMATAESPVEAVAYWIAGRLELAFDATARSDLRIMSLRARAAMPRTPELVTVAFQKMLAPLVDQLERGASQGSFVGTDPTMDAEFIHGTVWACTETHWAADADDKDRVLRRALEFCLNGIGARPAAIAAAVDAVAGP